MGTIGVFDSGIGGLSIAHAVKRDFPLYKIEYRTDSDHLPYGDKSKEQLLEYVSPIIKELSIKCDVIIIACNTVTTTIVKELRMITTIPIIGIEPMIKPASKLTKSGVITVCATPATINSQRYAELKAQYASETIVIEPDCSDWASLIEDNKINEEKIKIDILPSIAQGSDVIVLGCTHYHWIEQEINKIVGKNVTVLQPELAVIDRLRKIINLSKS